VAKTAQRPATYEDLLQVPDHLIAEIIEGELFTSPRPAGPHERALGAIHARIRTLFDDGDGPGGWWISVEPELHLASDVLVPDVCGWRRDRVGPHPLAGRVAATIAPDWICEVLSPRTGILDRTRKLPSYARHGVEYAWIVDTSQRTIEVFRLVEGRWSLIGVHGGDEPERIEPFDSVEILLERLWLPEPRPA
jgi:Uma2 family endonuclease